MNVSTNLERLLPSLYDFLSADPAPVVSGGCASPTSFTDTPTSPWAVGTYDPFSQPQIIAESYERWRRCIAVWRRVIGNDILFLTLLLHAGCLWSPDYAAIHTAKHAIHKAARSQSQTTHGSSSSINESSNRLTASSSPLKGSTPTNKRRGKRGFQSAVEVARAAQAEAAIAAAHEDLVDACPASMWALHVLHFLCLEEIYEVPYPDPEGKEEGGNANPKSGSEEDSTNTAGVSCGVSSDSDGTNKDDEDNEESGSSSSSTPDSHTSDGGSNYGESQDEVEVADLTNGTSVYKAKRGVKKRGRLSDEKDSSLRGSKRKRPHRRGTNAAGTKSKQASSYSPRRKHVRFEDRMESAFNSNPPTSAPSARSLAASSSLLPKINKNHCRGKKELQHHLEMSLKALRQEQAEREGRIFKEGLNATAADQKTVLSSPTLISTSTTTQAVAQNTTPPSVRAHALLLRATVSLVSEEEPLVQQVATALVDDWLGLLTPSTKPRGAMPRCENVSPNAERGGNRSYQRDGSLAAANETSTSNKSQMGASNQGGDAFTAVQNQHQLQQNEARHYWLSCLIKMVAFLDGMHSALREENAHLAAVIARQGINPNEAEDTFTKSLPAIFNCVVVEEVLRASYGHPSLSQTSLDAGPRLWMPPAVLLLPFHLLARGSRIGLWVPAAGTPTGMNEEAAATAAGVSPTRTQGRYLSYVVDSYGLHLETPSSSSIARRTEVSNLEKKEIYSASADQTTGQAQKTRTGVASEGSSNQGISSSSRLVFGLRAVESEALLHERCRPWVHALLPLRRSFDIPPSFPSSSTLTDGSAAATPTTPARTWCCTQASTAGCPRIELYVARTLVMLPTLTQDVTDSTPNSTSLSNSSSNNTSCAVAGDVRSRTNKNTAAGERPRRGGGRRGIYKRPVLSLESANVRRQHPLLFHTLQPHLRRTGGSPSALTSAGNRFTPRNGGGLNNYTRNSESGSSSVRSDPPQLILLYGAARGTEAAALRHIGFSVRTGSHHGLGRSGGSAGGVLSSAAAAGATTASVLSADGVLNTSSASTLLCSPQGRNTGGGGPKESTGRLTLARDALGTTLEGLYLIARRVMSLRGLYTATGATPASKNSNNSDDDDSAGRKFVVRCTGETTDAAAAVSNASACSNTYRGSKGSYAGDVTEDSSKSNSATNFAASGQNTRSVATVSSSQEAEVLGTIAATLTLTALLLSHNLMNELLEQPALVLWTTELASYAIEVSLFLPRPIPRLLKADGFALALLLHPAQSLLLMVGLVGTLVKREVQQQAETTRGNTHASESRQVHKDNCVPAWYPWWTAFRSVVLRDATLPSCLYAGIWALVTKADDAVALVGMHARWETSRRAAAQVRDRQAKTTAGSSNNDDIGERSGCGQCQGVVRAASTAECSSGGRRPESETGKRVLYLTKAMPSKRQLSNSFPTFDASTSSVRGTTADADLVPVLVGGHRLQLRSPAEAVTAATSQRVAFSAEESSGAWKWICGPAVLHQIPFTEHSSTNTTGDVPSFAFVRQLRIVTGAETLFVLDEVPPTLSQEHETFAVTLQHSTGRQEALSKGTASSSSLSTLTRKIQQTSAAASALWLSLEATCLQWPSSTTEC